VLTNLIENAIKYSPDGGRVEVSVTRVAGHHPFERQNGANKREWAVVRVKDHGQGIPRDQQPHLFRRFYRAGLASYPESSGLGLGLYISNRIVAAHSGQMTVESVEGEGSTFAFALPLDDNVPASKN
jgi:signal transduction histidine kinase